MTTIEPGYLALYRSGELERRTEALEARLACCRLCPRECGVNRLKNERGYCRSGRLPIVSAVCAHHGEEPPVTGTTGSGAVFFGNCNMRCVYCQNHQISQSREKAQTNEMECYTLAEKLLYLQDDLGCGNINFVSPSHLVPQLLRAILEAVPRGLRVPLVYNTSGYDGIATLRELDGIISIYLPDLRYASDEWAAKLSGAPDYVARSREAVSEMYRQVGDLMTDGAGLAQSGLIVRHLILPGGLAGSKDTLAWLAREFSAHVTVSIMCQYMPMHRAKQIPLLSRTISDDENEQVLDLLSELGLEKGWVQELEAAECWLPDFERESHPFSPVLELMPK